MRTARPAAIHLDLLDAGGAVQVRLVALLEADFADVVGAAVVGFDALGFELLEFVRD